MGEGKCVLMRVYGGVGRDVDVVDERRAGLTDGRCVFVAVRRKWRGRISGKSGGGGRGLGWMRERAGGRGGVWG